MFLHAPVDPYPPVEHSATRGSTLIDEIERGEKIQVTGIVKSATIKPNSQVPAYEVEIFDGLVAVIVFIFLVIVFIFLGYKFSPVIKVDSEFLYANKAKLPLRIINKATPMSISETTKIRGINADPKCFSEN